MSGLWGRDRLRDRRRKRPRRRALPRLAVGAALAVAVPGTLAVPADARTAGPPGPPPTAAASAPAADGSAQAAETARARAEARRTGKPVELPSRTTETARTVVNPDGTHTTTLTPGPERVRRDGRWRPVDATLVRRGGRVEARSHPGNLTLDAGGGERPRSLAAAGEAAPRDLVTLGTGEDEITLQWRGGLPVPVLAGTTARYPDAVPGADVLVEATRTGFEQFVEIRRRPDTGRYSYTLPVRTEGLRAAAQADGSVLFTDAVTGRQRAVLPAPVMWDAAVDPVSGEHTRRAPVDMAVIERGPGAVDLVLTPDADFLADPATRYPVTVDPGAAELGAAFDTYVQQGETADWSGDTELDFGNPGTVNADGTPRTARSFIQWDSGGLAGANVFSAELALWNFHSGNTDCEPYHWSLWSTGAPSRSSRWDRQPDWTELYASSAATRGNPACGEPGWITADATDLVQSWAYRRTSRGYLGIQSNTDDVGGWKRVNSSEHPENQPRLTVTYNTPPATAFGRMAGPPFTQDGDGVWPVDTLTPTLRATVFDADGDRVDTAFEVYDTRTGRLIAVLETGPRESGQTVDVVVPPGRLADGGTYTFRTQSHDGTHYHPDWSAEVPFTVVLPSEEPPDDCEPPPDDGEDPPPDDGCEPPPGDGGDPPDGDR
ncbi:DNRLRE domain-containing protein [Streptomyces sp. TRM 70361]|uniref:DNRLRE domain-containing protein n=1 Tax=Streptomyces sp. TRM 70361 TaxID=3116553 RepID=UPI002E7B403C|nr:DNRLRE domain-containing protein [Streptomyces sp. TRM 70361]MEE1938395.1 DNRLRE domain-containing protein [Streptomyces sp. TRM 70361]